MPTILPPYPVETPEYCPGMSVSVMPMTSKHANWLEDYEYYDQLGRDPLQERRIWSIADPEVRIQSLKEVLKEFPKMMHWRKILFKATVRGDEDMVRCLIDAGVDIQPDVREAMKEQKKRDEVEPDPDNIDLPETFDETCAPVHAAASKGHLNILKMFLESGIDVDVRGEFGDTPLICAHGRSDMMQYLLDQGANPLLRTYDTEEAIEWHGEHAKFNALERTLLHGNVDIIKRLLDVPEMQVTRAAVLGAVRGGYEALKLILDRGDYYPESENKRELLTAEQNQIMRDALPVAVEFGDFEAMKLVVNYQLNVDEEGRPVGPIPEELQKPFVYGAYNALCRNDVAKFKYIHDLGLTEHETMSLDKLPPDQRFNVQHLFDEAVGAGAIEAARYLIQHHGAKPDVYRLPSAVFPLYAAAMHGKSDMVRFLVEECKTDIHKGSGCWSAGPTALWIALKLKYFDVIAVLLEHGGPVDEVDEALLDPSDSMDAVLISDKKMHFSLQSEEKAKQIIDKKRKKYENPNPSYVRIKLTPEDKTWIKNLVPRKKSEELMEHGVLARVLNEEEQYFAEGFEWDDPRRNLPDYPIDPVREMDLREDDDLIPKFSPAFVAA